MENPDFVMAGDVVNWCKWCNYSCPHVVGRDIVNKEGYTLWLIEHQSPAHKLTVLKRKYYAGDYSTAGFDAKQAFEAIIGLLDSIYSDESKII